MAGTIGLIAPRAAIRFAADRAALSAYIGASPSGHNAAWTPTKKSADAILRTDAATLTARARSLERNHVNVAGALRKICDNVIYTGIRPQFTDANGRQLNELEKAFAGWARANAFYVWMQPLALRHWWTDGEIFAHLWTDDRRIRRGDINPLRVELLEQELVDMSKDGWTGDNVIRRGIEFDRYGDVSRYWVLPAHPGDYLFGASLDSKPVDAGHIAHMWQPLRASQSRGVSLMAPIIEEIKDLSEYKASERIAARLVSAFGVFIKQQYPDIPGSATVGGQDPVTREISDYIEAGRIQTLPPGTEIQVADASRPASAYEPYVKSSNKDQSVGFGLRYGNFSHDYTESSFSSERSAALDERRGWVVQQELLISTLCAPIGRRWLELEYMTGRTNISPDEVVASWVAPRWPWVDPVKDATAADKKLAMRVTSRRRICAEMGVEYDEIQAELNREEKDLPKETKDAQA